MVNPAGEIVYSVYKVLDFATSLKDGPWSNTGIAQAFNQAKKLPSGQVFFTDFTQYVPSYDAPAGFVATPIYSSRKQNIGTLIFQMPLDKISEIMSERSGLGNTGESYLVGSDFLMRSDSYLEPETHSVVSSFRDPENGKAKTEAVLKAISGQTGVAIINDYNNSPVLSAFTPIRLGNHQWALLAEKDVAEAFSATNSLLNLVLTMSVVLLIIILISSYFFGNKLAQPIVEFAQVVRQLANSQIFSIRLDVKQKDEIGEAGRAINTLLSVTGDSLEELNQVITHMSKGDFSYRVESDLKGDLLQLKLGVNDSANQIESIMEQVNQSMQHLAQGNFKQDVELSGQGLYLKILTQMRQSSDSVAQVMDEINSIMEEMNQGEFNGRIRVETQGDLDRLKRNINGSIESMAQAISAISDVVAAQAAGDLTVKLPSGTGQSHLNLV